MESDANVLQYLTRHVFLPPQLPQESESNSSCMDRHLLLEVEEASRNFIKLLPVSDKSTNVGTISNWQRASKMLRQMSNLHQDQFLIKQDLVSTFKLMETGGNILPLSAIPLTCVSFRRSSFIHYFTECRHYIPQAWSESYEL
jgi:hypothetical protein